MDLWNVDKLILFLLFAIPGFLMLKVNALLGQEPVADSSKQVIDAVAFSCVNYALLAWPILAVEDSSLKRTSPVSYYFFYTFVLLIAPVLWAAMWRTARTTQILQRLLPHPTARPWDFVFRQRKRYWIIVTFKDGKQVAGRYDSKSFSSAAPALEQLFLEQAWVLNQEGGFERARRNSAGLLIIGSEVRTVEFFEILEEEIYGNETDTKHAGPRRVAAEATGSGTP